ncbi:MAG TPA: permease prefix domain 1-containing protein [Candidatus Acidoferrum sp.]|nr:permease prefix domain 1-containing protein [Candidatus Acidoferrum sp.]
MPDWKKIVREELGSLPLSNGRKDEVVEELAQQLESAYEEAVAQGINEQEALRRSLEQFKDWEKLRGELFHSVEGTRLPVWEQKGLFSPRRWPVWAALGLALLFLAAPAFRQALAILPVPGSDPTASGPRIFSDRALRRLELSGDKQRYARALAFVALHSPKEDDLRAVNAAEKAIALDPQLTWIAAKVSHATYLYPGYDPHPWVERLKAWDPENAYPYILEADANIHSAWESRWAKYNAATPDLRQALAAEPGWREPMEKAFAAPRIDAYNTQTFALDRQVLQEQGLDRPDILIVNTWAQPIPDLTAMKMYAQILLRDVGASAEKAGHPEDALAAYRSVAQFGERLQVASASVVFMQDILANRLQQEACEKMLPVLRRQGRTQEASVVEGTLAGLVQADPAKKSWPSFSGEASRKRSARIVLFSGAFVMLLALVTAAWVIFLIALKWKPDLSRALNRLASALCVAPPLLLLACAVLFLGYYPYALPIAQYTSAQDLRQSFGPFIMNAYWSLDLQFSDVWLVRMFWPSVWGAVLALAAAVLLWLLARRQRPDDTRPA